MRGAGLSRSQGAGADVGRACADSRGGRRGRSWKAILCSGSSSPGSPVALDRGRGWDARARSRSGAEDSSRRRIGLVVVILRKMRQMRPIHLRAAGERRHREHRGTFTLHEGGGTGGSCQLLHVGGTSSALFLPALTFAHALACSLRTIRMASPNTRPMMMPAGVGSRCLFRARAWMSACSFSARDAPPHSRTRDARYSRWHAQQPRQGRDYRLGWCRAYRP